MTGDHYLIDSPELCYKFIIAHALTLDSLRKAHPGSGGEPHADFIIMMLQWVWVYYRLYACLVWACAAQGRSLVLQCSLFIRISCLPHEHSFAHSGWGQGRVPRCLGCNSTTTLLSFYHCCFIAANVRGGSPDGWVVT